MAKHLKTFTSDNERQTFEISNDYLEPYVSIVKGNGQIDTHYNLVPSIIITMEDSNVIKLYKQTTVDINTWNIAYPTLIVKVEVSNDIKSIERMTGLSIHSFNIPESVTRIGYNAFNSNSNLSSITIPSSITRIEETTFSMCPSLTSVTLTDSLTYIDESAFDVDNNIQYLKIIGKKDISNLLPTNLTDNLTHLYIDASLVETYKTYRDSIGKTFEVRPLT